MDTSRLIPLLERLAQAGARGVNLTPADVCPDDEELAAALAACLRVVNRSRAPLADEDPASTRAFPPPGGSTNGVPEATLSAPPMVPPVAGPDGGTGSVPPGSGLVPPLPGTIGYPMSAAAPTAASPPGYELLAELGRGGMGVVYRVRQIGLNRIVALKMILSGSHAGEAERRRFLDEAEAIAAIRHPGIVQVHDFGTHQGLPYFSMEFCSGGSLAGRLGGTPLAANEAAGTVEKVARAVQAAHDAGVVHRDLKPGNILLAEDGTPKVTDFGLAKRVEGGSGLTETGAVMGTPSYMAPEQAEGKSDVGPPADVWALGAILYEGLTGRPPFKAAKTFDTLMQVIGNEPVPPRQLNSRVPIDLETVCLKCLRKDPGGRYASAAALADDLARFLSGEPITARPVGRGERLVKWARRHPRDAALVATAALAGCLVVLGGVVYGLYADQQTRWLRQQVERRQHTDERWAAGKEAEAAGQVALARGQDTDAAGHFSSARQALEQALASLGSSGDAAEADLRDEIEARLAEVRRQASELDARQAARRGLHTAIARLGKHRDDLFYHDLSVGESDRAAGRAAVRRLAPAALAPLGLAEPLSADAAGRALDAVRPHFDSDEQRREVVRWCAEILLIWAQAEAGPPPLEPARVEAATVQRLQTRLDAAVALCRAHGVPTSAGLHEWRGHCLAYQGDKAGAAREREQAAALRPTTAMDHFVAALEAFRQGRTGDAENGCKEALRLQPSHAWAHYLAGLCHLRQRRWVQANAAFTTCLSQHPDFLWARLLRAGACIELKELDDADADLTLAAGQAGDATARYLVHMTRSRLALVRRQLPQARDALREAIACQPAGAFQAHANLAQVHREMGDHPAALVELGRALAVRPDDGRLHYTRGQVHLEAGDRAAAADAFRRAIAAAPADSRARWLASARVELGYLEHLQGNHAAALAAFDAALAVVADYGPAHRQRAQTLLALERHAEAGQALDRYLAGTPDDAVALKARGMIHSTLREYAPAALVYSRALQQKRDAEVLIYRGWAYLQLQSLPLALADFEAVLERTPENADALTGRGQVRALMGKVSEAVADAEAAVRQGRPTPTLLCGAAVIYARAARRSEQLDRNPNRPAASARRYESRAVELVSQAIDLVPRQQRNRFWHDQVEKDLSLRSLLGHPDMQRLARLASP